MVWCVDHLDYDVSTYISDTYLPTIRAKEWKSMTNDQYKYHLNDFVRTYGDGDITRIRYLTGYRANGTTILRRHNFIRYLLMVHKSGKRKITKRYYNTTPGHLRALLYKKEMRKLRALEKSGRLITQAD